MTISLPDLFVLLAYFCAILAIGWYTGRRHKTTDSYFLGNRSFSGWVLGISLIGTIISSVTFIAGPADAFKTAWLRVLTNLAVPFAAVFVAFVFVPYFRKRNISSAYAFLQNRFSSSLSLYAATLFLVSQLVRVSTVGYLLAILLQSLIGIPFFPCLLVAGGVTAIYTIKGGFSAVIWTDVIQTLVLVLGAIVATVVAINHIPGGLATVFHDAHLAHKLSFWDLNVASGQLEPTPWGFSLTEKTVSMLFITGLVGFLTASLDQTSVQRWASAKSTRDACLAVLILGIGAVPIWVAFKFLGTSLYVFFQYNPSDISTAILEGERKAEEIVPHFITGYLSPGLAGLVIAGALSAAMSTLSSSINAVSMVWVRDFYSRLPVGKRSDSRDLAVGKLAALVASVIMILGAWLIHQSSAKTLGDLILILTPLVGGTVPGVFLVGLLWSKPDSRAVWTALVVTWTGILYIIGSHRGWIPECISAPIDLYYVGLLGNCSIIIISITVSRFFPGKLTGVSSDND